MPITHIKTGGMEVIGNGTVSAFEEEPIEIALEHEDDENQLNLIFDFVENDEDSRLETELLGEGTGLRLILYNHNGMEAGPETPINLGTLAGRELYLMYSANVKQGDELNTEILSYSIYLEE